MLTSPANKSIMSYSNLQLNWPPVLSEPNGTRILIDGGALNRTVPVYPVPDQLVAEKLKEWGIETHEGIAKTGVVGVIKGQGDSKRSIGIRADNDFNRIATRVQDGQCGMPNR